jgi:hypothetical protein
VIAGVISGIRALKLLAEIFFMRNLGYFVIKVYSTIRAQQFSALEKDRNLPYLGSYLIVT